MARLHLTRWCAVLASLAGLAGGLPAQTAGQKLWPVRAIHGLDRIDVHDIAERFGLTAEWAKSGLAIELTAGGRTRMVFESRQLDIHFDGLRVFLGEPVLAERNTLWVSKLDVIKIVAPLLDPKGHLDKLPAAVPKTIVLDPGHGGSDPGTHNPLYRLWEKDVTLDVSLRLRALLEARGWKVIMVRDRDVELSHDKKADLAMRDELANRNKADLFLSIHFNSAPETTSGVETYTMAPQFMLSTGSESEDAMTKVAFPSNRLDYANLFFGEKLHRAMIAQLKAPDRGYKRGRRAVTRALDCPGALVECGYLSSNSETRLIATPAYRQKIAEALATGLQNYADAIAVLHPPSPAPRPLSPPTRPATAPTVRPSK
ncbi:MAG TPA: N-acetylmuramoyl-L-alanine amidase [Candidatus Didemnitutus sp.]|jgi:N-acetylmuramoyl-L-alanine amidase